MSGSRLVVRNILSTFATQIISWILTFAVMLYLPKYLGVDGMGKFAFAVSLVGLLSALVPLGTSSVLIRDISRDRSRTGELLLAALATRIPIGLAMTVLAIVIDHLLKCPPLTQTFILCLSFGIVLGAVNDALTAALQGQENIHRSSFAIIVERFLGSALTIVLVICRAPLWTLAAAGVFAVAISLLVNLTAFRPLLPTLHFPKKATVTYISKAGLPFAGWLIFRTFYGQTDPIVLALITNDKTVGWYAVAVRLVGTTLILPGAISTTLLPTLTRLYHENLEEFQLLSRRMLALAILCGTPIAMAFLCVPDRMLNFMRFPGEFSGSIPVLRVSGIGVFFYYMAMILGTIIIAADGQKKMFRASVIATVTGIPACFLGAFITHRLWHNGAVGAIWSDVLLEVYLTAAYLRMAPARTFNNESLSLIGRTVLASVPLIALLSLTGHKLGLWIVVPSLLLYALMCWLLRCFDPQYLVMMRKILRRPAKA